jgi:type IV pilus assembly protein PilA
MRSGFTLIELLIAIAIIGILMTIAIPSYQQYTRKAHYSEIVQAAAPYKIAVESCFQSNDALDDCSAGKNGIPPNIDSGQGVGLIDSITVANQGQINIIPKKLYGIDSADNYQLTPTDNNGVLTWTASGKGVDKGYAN